MYSFKLFLEYYQEEEGSSFTDENKNYDINKIFKETEKAPVETMKVLDLDWILDGTPIGNDDMSRIKAISDLSTPLLITKKGDKILVVDGFHRLVKAKMEGHPTVLVKWVSSKIMKDSEIK